MALCPAVCLSVCLSQARVLPKWLTISCKQCCMVAYRDSVMPKVLVKFQWCHPQQGYQTHTGCKKFAIFNKSLVISCSGTRQHPAKCYPGWMPTPLPPCFATVSHPSILKWCHPRHIAQTSYQCHPNGLSLIHPDTIWYLIITVAQQVGSVWCNNYCDAVGLQTLDNWGPKSSTQFLKFILRVLKWSFS